MTGFCIVIAALVVGLLTFGIVQEIAYRREQRAREAAWARWDGEREARMQRPNQWRAHGAKRVGPNNRWWSIPGDKEAGQ